MVRYQKSVAIVTIIVACLLVTWMLLFSVGKIQDSPSYPMLLRSPVVIRSRASRSTNIVTVYTGRWQFLRVLLPYLYRDLRVNGGVIDEVWFMIVHCDEGTMNRLTKFVEAANGVHHSNVFLITRNSNPTSKKKGNVTFPYFEILPRIMADPNINFFKIDDDIVYIHPDAFSNVLAQNDPKCLMYFFNIAGSHWRLNWIYQTHGLYKDPKLNPKNLTFGYDPHAKCGWESPECNEMALRMFLYHHNNNSLDKLLFNYLEYLSDKKQFSINAMLFNQDMIDMPALIKTDHLTHSDEPWWTVDYTQNSNRANCIVGNALVVHFSYYKTLKYLLEKTHILEDFEDIVRNSRKQFKMDDDVLWTLML